MLSLVGRWQAIQQFPEAPSVVGETGRRPSMSTPDPRSGVSRTLLMPIPHRAMPRDTERPDTRRGQSVSAGPAVEDHGRVVDWGTIPLTRPNRAGPAGR